MSEKKEAVMQIKNIRREALRQRLGKTAYYFGIYLFLIVMALIVPSTLSSLFWPV